MNPSRAQLRATAAGILSAALRAAAPGPLVSRNLKLRGRVLEAGGTRCRLGRGRIVLVAVGKAALEMAREAELLLGDRLAEGIAVATTAPKHPLARVRVREAGHPIPDARGIAAALEVEALARGLGRDDLLLVLLSGGASALLPAPADGITLEEKARTTALLLRAGATIHELNAVRKHLSRLKGGGLARAAAPARVVALALSDVVGDDLSTIGSGPTVPDPTTFAQALAVLERRGVLAEVDAAVRERFAAGARGELAETAKPGEALFRRVVTRVVGSGRLSVLAAASEARRRGLRPLVLTTRLEGEAREAARVLVAILRERVEQRLPARAPSACSPVARPRSRCVEQARAAAIRSWRWPPPRPSTDSRGSAVVASLATDGIDGASDGAGGIVDDTTLARGLRLGLAPPAAFLAENDTRNYLGPLGDLILTGPTGTNVADVVAMLATPAARKGYNARHLPGGAP